MDDQIMAIIYKETNVFKKFNFKLNFNSFKKKYS